MPSPLIVDPTNPTDPFIQERLQIAFDTLSSSMEKFHIQTSATVVIRRFEEFDYKGLLLPDVSSVPVCLKGDVFSAELTLEHKDATDESFPDGGLRVLSFSVCAGPAYFSRIRIRKPIGFKHQRYDRLRITDAHWMAVFYQADRTNHMTYYVENTEERNMDIEIRRIRQRAPYLVLRTMKDIIIANAVHMSSKHFAFGKGDSALLQLPKDMKLRIIHFIRQNFIELFEAELYDTWHVPLVY